MEAGHEAQVPVIVGANDRDLALGDAHNKDQIFSIFARTAAEARKLYDPLLRIDQALERIESGQGPFGSMLRDDSQQYARFRDQLANVRQYIAAARSNAFLQSDEMYAGWSRALGAMIQNVDAFSATPLLTTSAVYDNLNGFAREMRDALNDLRRDPQKYMRIKIF